MQLTKKTPSHISTHHSFPIIIPHGRSSESLPLSGREWGSVFLCLAGFALIMAGAILISTPYYQHLPESEQFTHNLIFLIGLLVLIPAIGILCKTGREKKRVFTLLASRDEISLDTISRETGLPPSKVHDIISRYIDAGFIKGTLDDNMFYSKVIVEWVGPDTIRCPHCGKDVKVPEKEF